MRLALAAALIGALLHGDVVRAGPAPVSATDAAAIGVEAYAYAYPLVLMELTRRAATNVGPGAPPSTHAYERAPMNQFAHQRAFADGTATEPPRPNPDVLASTLWFDVAAEPLVITIPESGGRYYTMPMFDLWSDVFAAPGSRTTGTGAQTWAITAPAWSGMLPEGVERITAPTAVGWIVARIDAHGAADLDAVHRFQDGLRAVPLSAWGREYTPPAGTFDASRDRQPVAAQILRLTVEQYFGIFTDLTTANPPHANDYPMLHRIARIGLTPGRPFDQTALPPDVRAVLQQTPRTAGQRLFDAFKRSGTRVNGWRSLLTPMGAYGADYRRRQVVAFTSLGVDLSEDVYYLTTINDVDGKPLESDGRYAVHFDANGLPPVRAFWSLVAYEESQLLPAGKRLRSTIGSRDPLVKNADGSVDLLLQTTPPPPDKTANWLPAPTTGRYSLMLRLYWPELDALDGTWPPPSVIRAPK